MLTTTGNINKVDTFCQWQFWAKPSWLIKIKSTHSKANKYHKNVFLSHLEKSPFGALSSKGMNNNSVRFWSAAAAAGENTEEKRKIHSTVHAREGGTK